MSGPRSRQPIPDDVRERIIALALDEPALSPRELAVRFTDTEGYVSDGLAKWMERQDMGHVRGAPYHPMTQGKIERWHQTLKNRILLENYYLPGDLEAQIEAFAADYNDRRYHESIDNLLRARPDDPAAQRKDQTPDHRPTSLAASTASRVTSSTSGARASLNLGRSLSQKL
jgi:transposase InsO family protein